MHQERMLNSSSSAATSSSFSSSSSFLISASDLHRSSISASSSSSSYNPVQSDHHPQLPLHPKPQSPHPHYYHLHHLHTQYPSIDSPHHLHPSSHVDFSHRSFPRASITTGSINNSRLSGELCKDLSSHNHSNSIYCQAHINSSISNRVISTDESSSNHGYGVSCNDADCSPRSVIRSGQPFSPASSSNSHWLSSYYANLRANGGTMSPATACPHPAPELSMTKLHHPTLHETNQGAVLQTHMQSDALDHCQMPPPWSPPSTIHQHYCDVCSSCSSPPQHSGQNSRKAGTEKVYKGGGMRKNPKANLERGSSRSVDFHKQRETEHTKSGYFSGSVVEENKPYKMISIDSATAYGPIKQRRQVAMQALSAEQDNFDGGVNQCTVAKPMYLPMPTSIWQADHKHKVLQKERSLSCDLRSCKRSTTCATPIRYCTGGMQQAGYVNSYKMDEVASRSPDAQSHYSNRLASVDGHGSAKGRAQLGSKWEDAEKWVRPPICDQHAVGCKGFSLLRMSNCVSTSGTAVKTQHTRLSNGVVPSANLSSHECVSNYGSDFSASERANYRWSGSESARLYGTPESRMPTHTRPFPTYPQFAADQHMNKEQVVKPRSTDDTEQNLLEDYTQEARETHCSTSAGSDSNIKGPPELARDNQIVASTPCGLDSQASNEEGPACASDWKIKPLPNDPYPSHQLMTDRFASASGEILSCAITSYTRHNDEGLLMPTMQGSVQMPMVSLREVGTQMSSIDGSGSISRFTSKNGSPQKPLSPTRHTTPAYVRSLNGSTNSISNLKEGGKKAIDIEELVECHRAKLEVQALSEGERVHSFHRTVSNWSSREMEEEDLSRSLRHSANLDEDHTSKDHPWPSQSFSWDKHESSKLAKLLIKEARIQAWEDKKKKKAEAQLKRLEESLAKKRSQTTNKIMGNLGAAQRKAEEMRASVYTQQRGASSKAHGFRHRSLSPLSRCICFSPLK